MSKKEIVIQLSENSQCEKHYGNDDTWSGSR